jgi:hypothetical protein
MKTLIPVLLAVLFLCPNPSSAQEPSPPASQAPATTAAPSAAGASQADPGSSSSRTKSRQIPSFLIIGTVFNENAISFPGVQVRIRRSGEKKFLWDMYTNSRGEFAQRVPPGFEYEVVAHVKKYEDQTQTVDSKVDVQQRVSIKMQPKGQAKAGEKP